MLLRNYIWPVAASLLLHAAIVTFVLVGWEAGPTVKPPTQMPKFVEAKLVELKPKAKPASSAKPKQVQKVDLTQKRREQELAEQRAREQRAKEQQRQARLKREKEEKQRQEEAERKRQAEQKKRAEEQRRQMQEFEKALEEEQGMILEEAYITEAQSYIGAIQQRIIQNWSRPSSARNNMEALLSIQLVPTGRVANVSIVKSSGNAAFDRSAEQAVKRVETFPEVKDMPPEVFERHFRRFNLLFKPQDLRQ